MSILQEYQSIRRQIGEKKYWNIESFLEKHPHYFLSDVYYKTLVWDEFLVWEMKQEKDIKRKKKLAKEYKQFIENCKKNLFFGEEVLQKRNIKY